MKRSLRPIWLMLLLCLTIPLASARAQNLVEMDQLQIDIWPEYDRAEVLVIYHIKIAATSSMPAQVSLRIPREAITPYNVAMKDVDGMLYNIKYDTAVDGEWNRISFTAPSSELQIEYYDPRLEISGTSRLFSYRWPADYKVRSLQFRIQQPFNASDIQLVNSQLKMQEGLKGDDGLTYFFVPVSGSLEAGKVLDLSFRYSKPDTALSSSQAPVQPVRTTTGTTNSNILGAEGTLAWIAVGAALFLGGVIWFLQQRKLGQELTETRRRHGSSRPSRQSEPARALEPVYCQQCGKRAAPGDAFCRACGTRLRSES